MSDNISWILELTIKSGELDNFKALVNEMVEATQANEPQALAYEWFISDDNERCHIYERYADSAAALVHMKNFGEKFAERFMVVVKPGPVMVYGNPSDELHKTLSRLGATFLAPIDGFAR